MKIRNRVKKRLFAYLQTAPPVVAVVVRKQCYTARRLGSGTALAELATEKIEEIQKEIPI
jgi:hypothetical protein